MELVLTGRRIDAAEAERLGLVNEVAPKRDWLERGAGAGAADRQAPPDRRPARQAGGDRRRRDGRSAAGLEHERRLYELAMATEDRVEGMGAFLEKRKPEFKGA